jgi:amino acid transporter
MAVVRPGDIAVLAFAFATYAGSIADPFGDPAVTRRVYAAAAVVVLTALNVLGVRAGARAQNLLTSAKVLGLLLIVVVAWITPPARAAAGPVEGLPPSLALIFVLFAYGGWNEMAYVAAEVRNPGRNLGRALVLGTVAVAGLYLVITGAFLHALGYAGLAASKAAAAEAVSAVAPRWGGGLVAGLVCISALGAVNGLILAGARISYAMGRDHAVFRPLGVWHAGRNAPVRALLLQGVIAVILILALGSFLDAVLYTASVVYLFYLGTTLAVIVLRRREPNVPRPFRVPGYPVIPLVFAATCAFLIHAAVTYKPAVAGAAAGLLVLGLPLYAVGRRKS